MQEIKINGQLVFEIRSKNHWINSFPGAIADLPMSEKYLWVDNNGNIATCGEDFMFAEDAGAYPIKIYHVQRTCHIDPKKESYVKSLNAHIGL
ncbi:hypothetical protein C1637_09875 [Chryseobacterium lactis]|uniref:Uncharacterized protein n=1 Tax=Chryseobacterium lactis TaxID=1241981 RepID=A0A3G6RBY5_CHRLC|nr:hypothetical protein [Chryseobacterium lactis]AZA82181.1 hypothetical protein EG342_09825 [Chryseobacterium lactis]AZB02562.1 hypothetical protein EG341_00680 [Chryseobacterium lactis]PNW14143.1 hypothetical protein C1637_09875 [Chryseobacterium lactis]